MNKLLVNWLPNILRKPKRNTVRDLRRNFKNALAPPPDLILPDWADKKRILPSNSSSEDGLWRTSRFPFLYEIMLELSPKMLCKMIVVMKGAQIGCTEIAINWILYIIEHAPAPTMYVQKTLDAIKAFIIQRFDPSVEVCPAVKSKLTDNNKDKKNNRFMKIFLGGFLRFVGANSGSALRSMPIQNIVLDEEDSYVSDLEDEGSPGEIAIARSRNFPRRKIFRLSTPVTKETSVIEPLFLEGDQRRYYVPCPFCFNLDWIRWENIKYGEAVGNAKDDCTNTMLQCSSCKQLISEKYKTWMFSPVNGAKWIKENPKGPYPSFHLSGLYSPLGFFSWKDAAQLWVRANRLFDKALLKVFVNTVLGETFSEMGKTVDADILSSHKESYQAEIPKEVLILVAGVDVMEDRIELEIVGFGKDQENWSIDYIVLEGNTNYATIWKQLDVVLSKVYKHETGKEITVACAAIDSGYMAKVVYNYCKSRENKRYFPIKGRDGWGRGYLDRPKKRDKEGIWLFILYVDEIKSKVYSQLKLSKSGPNYCHFPQKSEYDSRYFHGLTSERLTLGQRRGRKSLIWELPTGKINEPLDCRVYAIGALNIIKPNFDKMPINEIVTGSTEISSKVQKRRVISKGISE